MNDAQNQNNGDWWKRPARTLVQTAVGGGTLVLLTDQIVSDLPQAYAVYAAIIGGFLASILQNVAEDNGWVKPMLKNGDTARRA